MYGLVFKLYTGLCVRNCSVLEIFLVNVTLSSWLEDCSYLR